MAWLSISYQTRCWGSREISRLQLEKADLKATPKTKCGSIKAAKISLPKQHREHAKLSSQINAVRKRIERDVLKGIKAKWFENVNHDEINSKWEANLPRHSHMSGHS